MYLVLTNYKYSGYKQYNNAPLSGFPCPYVINNNGGKVKGAEKADWA
jgi:hypothetical protein